MSSYIPRGRMTPYMERKLKALQANEWSDQDAGRVHKGRLEREREAALAARSGSCLLHLHHPHKRKVTWKMTPLYAHPRTETPSSQTWAWPV